MRVLIVYHFFAHYRAAVMELLARDPQLEVTFAGDTRESDGNVAPWNMGPEIRFVRTRCYYLGPLMLQPGLLWHVLTRRYDRVILLGNASWPMTWLAAVVARLKCEKVYFWSHGWVRPDRGAVRWIRARFYRLAHGIMLYGHYAKCIGLSVGIRPERMTVIYNSLDTQEQTAARERVTPAQIAEQRRTLFGDRAASPLLICSSRLTALRRLDLLLDAMAILKDRGREMNLLLVGDGPVRGELEAQARRLGLHVHFFGACYDESALARLTMASDLTVAPGKVGLTAMQSLGFGTPVLTHGDVENQMPEWEAIVPGRTGDLFKRDDVESLAATIERWFAAAPPREEVRERCYEMIARLWNPRNQHRLIRRALAGLPADDLQGPMPRNNPQEAAAR